MKCMICENVKMVSYFTKTMESRKHTYLKCESCGLVIDKTTYGMNSEDWKELNDLNKEAHGVDESPDGDPNYIERLKEQAVVIDNMYRYGVFGDHIKAIDYGCGDGKLSDYVDEHYKEKTGNKLSEHIIGKYDKYLCPEGALDYYDSKEVKAGKFDLVITCSVFEHLLGMKDVNEILSLANDTGTVALHTLVCEEVPQDPEWYYLAPPHCTLWTNKAMSKIYHLYGFVGCAYHVEARMWFFFKEQLKYSKLCKVHEEIEGTWVFSDEFVEYWKQKPYRK